MNAYYMYITGNIKMNGQIKLIKVDIISVLRGYLRGGDGVAFQVLDARSANQLSAVSHFGRNMDMYLSP